MKFGIRKPSIKKRIAARTSVKRMVRSKVRAPRGMGWVTDPKRAAYNRVYNRTTTKACYVATAVYGDVDNVQVVKLRKYRDNVLRKSMLGRLFIYFYYAISPKLVFLFRDIKVINKTTKWILDRFIKTL